MGSVLGLGVPRTKGCEGEFFFQIFVKCVWENEKCEWFGSYIKVDLGSGLYKLAWFCMLGLYKPMMMLGSVVWWRFWGVLGKDFVC